MQDDNHKKYIRFDHAAGNYDPVPATKPQSTTETLEPCPLSHYVHAGLRAHKTGLDPRIVCLDCGLTLRAPDWIKVYERWQSRPLISPASTAPVVDNDLDCPFCRDTDFDLPGLKHHLLSGYCDAFHQTPTLDDAVAQRLRDARLDVRDCERVKRQC